MTAERREAIIQYMRDSLSFEQIAPLVGVSKSTLYNHGDDLRADLAVLDAADLRREER